MSFVPRLFSAVLLTAALLCVGCEQETPRTDIETAPDARPAAEPLPGETVPPTDTTVPPADTTTPDTGTVPPATAPADTGMGTEPGAGTGMGTDPGTTGDQPR